MEVGQRVGSAITQSLKCGIGIPFACVRPARNATSKGKCKQEMQFLHCMFGYITLLTMKSRFGTALCWSSISWRLFPIYFGSTFPSLSFDSSIFLFILSILSLLSVTCFWIKKPKRLPRSFLQSTANLRFVLHVVENLVLSY